MTPASLAPRALGAAFAISGTVHLVRPQVFEPIVPRVLPQPSRRPLVFLSGIAELVLSAGLLRLRPWARWPSVLLLLAICPANVQMALDAGTDRTAEQGGSRIVAWGRLPLQGVLIWAALQCRPPAPPATAPVGSGMVTATGDTAGTQSAGAPRVCRIRR